MSFQQGCGLVGIGSRCYSQEVAEMQCLQGIEKHGTLNRQVMKLRTLAPEVWGLSVKGWRSAVQAFDRWWASGQPAPKPKQLQLIWIMRSWVLRGH